MRKIIITVISFFLLNHSLLFAQETIWNSPQAYLGLTPPGDSPIVFAPGRLADTGYWVGSRVAFTEDGKQFIYGKNTTWFDNKNQKLMRLYYDGNKWIGPVLVFEQFACPTFSADGKQTLYLSGGRGMIYKSEATDTGWTYPTEYLKRSYTLYNFMPTRSGHYYVGSNGTWGPVSDYNQWKFSVLAGIGSDTSIQSLGEPLNSPGFNGDLYIAPDESFMIISNKESPTFESELAISFRKRDQTWTKPLSLGAKINQGIAHRWGAYLSPDHKYLFYTRGTSEKDCRIYWVRFNDLLEKLRKESFQ